MADLLVSVSKTGRVACEQSKGRGQVIHLVSLNSPPRGEWGYLDNGGWKPALCGTVPGKKRGNGWSAENGQTATCQKCLAKAIKSGLPVWSGKVAN